MALALGSDVPFFLGPPAALCKGRGEVITELAPRELCVSGSAALLEVAQNLIGKDNVKFVKLK